MLLRFANSGMDGRRTQGGVSKSGYAKPVFAGASAGVGLVGPNPFSSRGVGRPPQRTRVTYP
eukprot:11186789-Lingulodinium_polyedra.AAC.1